MVKELFNSFIHPWEIKAMYNLKFRDKIRQPKKPLVELIDGLDDRDFCYTALTKVSRSFAVVIQQLPEDLKDPVCVFYLILRGLDSIEDDMDFAQEPKLLLLRSFYEKCEINNWNIEGVGDSEDYRVLLKHFEKVIGLYLSLKPSYRKVISDITKRMGNGMADFAEKKVYSLDDYNLYCHYVAGLVGIGLSGLFSASTLEAPMLETEERLSNSMGLFLQKTNIIRDYHEDLHSGRIFWPGEVWDKYSSEIGDFEKAPTQASSMACLNHLVLDAMQHVEDSLEYMSMLHNKQIFRFCAIPQVMAIATLAKVFNNSKVFTSNVKIRKGLGAKLMYYTNDMSNLRFEFHKCLLDIENKLNPLDPHYLVTKNKVEYLLNITSKEWKNPYYGIQYKLYRMVS